MNSHSIVAVVRIQLFHHKNVVNVIVILMLCILIVYVSYEYNDDILWAEHAIPIFTENQQPRFAFKFNRVTI